mgnify:CR=1 FL=1
MDVEEKKAAAPKKRASAPKNKKTKVSDAAAEHATTAKKRIAKDQNLTEYYAFLLRLVGRYAIDDINFVPHVLDREYLVFFCQSEMKDTDNDVKTLENEIYLIAKRQLKLLANHTVTHTGDNPTARAKIKDAFLCHAVWHRAAKAARKLWSINALLSNKGKNRTVLSHRYGYYATSIANYLDVMRIMPPLELFEGLAAATPRFVEACTVLDDASEEFKMAISKDSTATRAYIRATQSIRSSLSATRDVVNARMHEEAKDLLPVFDEMDTDFYSVISSPEKLMQIRDVERAALERKHIVLDSDYCELMICDMTTGVIRTVQDRWLDFTDADPVDDALESDLRFALYVFQKHLWEKNRKGDAPALVQVASVRFGDTCINALELTPEVNAEVAVVLSKQPKRPNKQVVWSVGGLLQLMELPGVFHKCVSLRVVEAVPPDESKEPFDGRRPPSITRKPAAEEEEEEEEDEDEDEDEEDEYEDEEGDAQD